MKPLEPYLYPEGSNLIQNDYNNAFNAVLSSPAYLQDTILPNARPSHVHLKDKYTNAEQHGTRTWSLINTHRGNPKLINVLLYLAETLETHTANLIKLQHLQYEKQLFDNSKTTTRPSSDFQLCVDSLSHFYSQPVLKLRKRHKTTTSLRSQLLSSTTTTITRNKHTIYHLLDEITDTPNAMDSNDPTIMDEDPPMYTQDSTSSLKTGTEATHPKKLSTPWVTDPSISQLTSTCLKNLHAEREKLQEAGEDPQEATQYKAPTDGIVINERNRIRLSIKRARNSDSAVPMMKAFKSFAAALRRCDTSLAFLPVSTSKQNLPSLATSTQISALDNNKLLVYFKPYFTRQKHSLSGYIYITTQLSFEDMMIAQPIYEWLETNRYSIRPCPNTEDEMVQIGALCYGSEYIFREDLKAAIQEHSMWTFPSMQTPPIIQLSKGDFRGPKKSTKMIFVHTERAKQHEVGKVFSKLYDGTSKQYPNGIMMLFIPLYDHIIHEPSYRQKVIYNHERYLGEEEALCIHGLQDFNMIVTLKNGQHVSLRMLLRSIPATQGMSRPQLFQLIETNSQNIIIATYQKSDRAHVAARKMTLETDLKAQLTPEYASKIFQSEADGLWFTPILKTKQGQIIAAPQTTKSNLDYIQYTNTILSSPPKKRTFGDHLQPPAIAVNYAGAEQPLMDPKYHQRGTRTPNQPVHSPQGPTVIHNRPIPTTMPEEIHQRFLTVENEMKEQKTWNQEQTKWNAHIDYRMDYLEDTTTSTDMKVDTILNKLDSWDIPTKRRGVNTTHEERSAPQPHLQSMSGAMES